MVGRGENEVIRALTPSALPIGCGVSVGIGDDAAVLDSGDVWSMDVLVEGVHFDDRLSMEDVGYKAVVVSVSDVAAMGARPRWVLLGLSLPDDDPERVAALSRGVRAATEAYGLALIGGDTTRSKRGIVVTSVVGGTCSTPPLLRSDAQIDDDLWVTGSLGAAGGGWSRSSPSNEELQALRHPVPPVDFAVELATTGLAHAAMDLSDGLAVDLQRLCTASALGAHVVAGDLPVAPDATLQTATCGGEDYQLVFTAPRTSRVALDELAQRHRIRLTRVGTLVPGDTATLDVGWPEPLFAHFGGPA